MKIRSGFVSNSSSSSFLVELPKPIEEYSLDEFRELLNNSFDPVKMLYEDLKSSNKKYSDWKMDEFNITTLKENQYIVDYGNEIQDDYEAGSFMEYDFMPNLSIVKNSISFH